MTTPSCHYTATRYQHSKDSIRPSASGSPAARALPYDHTRCSAPQGNCCATPEYILSPTPRAPDGYKRRGRCAGRRHGSRKKTHTYPLFVINPNSYCPTQGEPATTHIKDMSHILYLQTRYHNGSKARGVKRTAEDTRGHMPGKCKMAVLRKRFVPRLP